MGMPGASVKKKIEEKRNRTDPAEQQYALQFLEVVLTFETLCRIAADCILVLFCAPL